MFLSDACTLQFLKLISSELKELVNEGGRWLAKVMRELESSSLGRSDYSASFPSLGSSSLVETPLRDSRIRNYSMLKSILASS